MMWVRVLDELSICLQVPITYPGSRIVELFFCVVFIIELEIYS